VIVTPPSTTTTWASICVVEFTGSNWTVTREPTGSGTNAFGAAYTTGAENSINLGSTLSDVTKAFWFFYSQQTGTALTRSSDVAHAVKIISTTQFSLFTQKANLSNSAWAYYVVENSQADGTARNLSVQTMGATWVSGSTTPWDTTTATPTTVDAMDETSVMGCKSAPANISAAPSQGQVGAILTNTNEVTLVRGTDVNDTYWRLQITEWPEDPDVGGVTVLADLLSSTVDIYQPTLEIPVAVEPATLDSSVDIYQPTIDIAGGPVTVLADLLSAAATLYQPTIDVAVVPVTVLADLLASTVTFYQPVLSGVAITDLIRVGEAEILRATAQDTEVLTAIAQDSEVLREA
jgi:hypothetical protein